MNTSFVLCTRAHTRSPLGARRLQNTIRVRVCVPPVVCVTICDCFRPIRALLLRPPHCRAIKFSGTAKNVFRTCAKRKSEKIRSKLCEDHSVDCAGARTRNESCSHVGARTLFAAPPVSHAIRSPTVHIELVHRVSSRSSAHFIQ